MHKSTSRIDGKSANRTAKKKDAFLVALETKAGNISQACIASGVGRRTYYEWLEKDVDFLIKVEDINEALIDWGESLLKAQMHKGDTTAIIFFLKTKGKKRGYVERQEVTGTEGRPFIEKLIVKVVHVKGGPARGGGNGDGDNGHKP